MQWSPQQEAALKAVKDWRSGRSGEQVFRLFGYAGTGKTTMARAIADDVGQGVHFACFTGKAALVLRKKGCNGASTIHRLIYKVREDPVTGEHHFLLNTVDSPMLDAKLLIVDEVSMVDEDLAKDLLSFDKPILVLGDPAQLPPIRGAGYFTNGNPNIMLTEIHRQAADNPIIRLATDLREGRRLHACDLWGPDGTGACVLHKDDLPPAAIVKAGQVLVGLNRTRTKTNGWLRQKLFPEHSFKGHRPGAGERLVCLKNKHDKGFLNGSLWTVGEVTDRAPDAKKPGDPNTVYMRIDSLDEDGMDGHAAVPQEFFQGKEEDIPLKTRNRVDQFTYGYALTCHKAQGSQWDDVLVYDESWLFGKSGGAEMSSRWAYTAMTRAAKTITWVLS